MVQRFLLKQEEQINLWPSKMSYSAKMVSFTKIDFSSNVLKSTQNSIISTIFISIMGHDISMWNCFKNSTFEQVVITFWWSITKLEKEIVPNIAKNMCLEMKWGHVWFHPSVFVMQQSHTSSMQHLIWVNSIKAGQLLRGCDTWNPYWAMLFEPLHNFLVFIAVIIIIILIQCFYYY